MMFRITLLLLCVLTFGTLRAEPPQNEAYQYFVNLSDIQNDQVQIELITPKITKSNITFYLPKIIPGTYTIYDFGRFVSDFHAFDREGNELTVSHPETNAWDIEDAKKLYRIRYKIDDSFDAKTGKAVLGMSGTNIQANTNVMLNGHGFYGYFEDMKRLTFEVNIEKPKDFYGSSALIPIRQNSKTDTYQLPSYNHLVDSPMMYCKPDTTTIMVANTEVLISVFSPSGNVKSSFIAEKYGPLLQAQKEYLGGNLPVKKYAFVMYFLSPEYDNVGTGALEHNYSSLYVLPDMPQEQIAPFLVDIAAHEFFHIVTPLNIHSKEIHYFDFNTPEMSRHLWMYEGVTEYFAHHVQVKSGLTDFEHFLNSMEQKIFQTQNYYNDKLPFTEMSKNCLSKHSNEYGNVYQKGALIGLCLDVELRRLSDGSYGLVNMMHDLSAKFGQERPFKDRRLFKEIKKVTYPEISKFLKKYVAGETPLPLAEIFQKVGVQYTEPQAFMDFTLGSVSFDYNQETNRIFVQNIKNLNTFGKEMDYQLGDEFFKMGGQLMPENGFQAFFKNVMSTMKEGETFEVEVYRKDNSGEAQLVTLSAKGKKIEKTKPAQLHPMENPTEQQLKLRKDWLGR